MTNRQTTLVGGYKATVSGYTTTLGLTSEYPATNLCTTKFLSLFALRGVCKLVAGYSDVADVAS